MSTDSSNITTRGNYEFIDQIQSGLAKKLLFNYLSGSIELLRVASLTCSGAYYYFNLECWETDYLRVFWISESKSAIKIFYFSKF